MEPRDLEGRDMKVVDRRFEANHGLTCPPILKASKIQWKNMTFIHTEINGGTELNIAFQKSCCMLTFPGGGFDLDASIGFHDAINEVHILWWSLRQRRISEVKHETAIIHDPVRQRNGNDYRHGGPLFQ